MAHTIPFGVNSIALTTLYSFARFLLLMKGRKMKTSQTMSLFLQQVPVPGVVGTDSHTDAQASTGSTSQFTHLLKPFAVLLLLVKSTYSLSDSCMCVLLLAIVMLIRIVGVAFKVKSSDIDAFLDVFPTNEYKLRTLANCSDKGFAQVICCPKCFKLYDELQKWSIYFHSKETDFL